MLKNSGRKRSNKLTEQKKNRIAAAITVNAVILIVILVAVVIYQLAVIVRTANQVKQLEEEYERYEKLLKEGEIELDELEEMLGSDQQLLYLALKNGYEFVTENN